MIRSFIIAVACALLALSAVGCKLLPEQPYPAKDRFGLRAEGIQPASAATPNGAIKVATVRIAPPYDQRGFVYRTGELTYNSDYYNLFVADPGDLLTGAIASGLTATQRFKSVVGPSSIAGANYTLELTVTELCGDFRSGSQSKAAIAIHAVLLEDTDAGTLILSQRAFQEVEPIGSNAPAELCRGWGVALGRCITQMSEWAHEALPTSGRAATQTSSR